MSKKRRRRRTKKELLGSKLTEGAKAALARTYAARDKIDASLAGFVDDDPTPVMIKLRRRKVEQPKKSKETALQAALRKERTRTATKARTKRASSASVRKEDTTATSAFDAAIDDYLANGAAVVREVKEQLASSFEVPPLTRGLVLR